MRGALAAGLAEARAESLSAEAGWEDGLHRRSAEVAIQAGGGKVRIQLVKVDGMLLDTGGCAANVATDLVRLGVVKREKPAGAYRYELVRL